MSSYTGIKEVDAFIELMRSMGYELVGDFGRDKLVLGKVEQCFPTKGEGECYCAISFELVLHEQGMSDTAMVVFFDFINFPQPFESISFCQGVTQIELIAETENARQTIEKWEYPPCIITA